MTTQIPNVTLSNGVADADPRLRRLPDRRPSDTERVVTDALARGYRASTPRPATTTKGQSVARSRQQRHPARELFVTTKMWIQHTGEATARREFDRSLRKLGLDYLDLYLIHQPLGDYYSSWRAMQKLNGDGLARAIGVSNFYPDRLVDLILNTDVTPAVNQIETHPFFQRHADQQVMVEYGVQIESWGPFAEGKNDLFTNPMLRRAHAGERRHLRLHPQR